MIEPRTLTTEQEQLIDEYCALYAYQLGVSAAYITLVKQEIVRRYQNSEWKLARCLSPEFIGLDAESSRRLYCRCEHSELSEHDYSLLALNACNTLMEHVSEAATRQILLLWRYFVHIDQSITSNHATNLCVQIAMDYSRQPLCELTEAAMWRIGLHNIRISRDDVVHILRGDTVSPQPLPVQPPRWVSVPLDGIAGITADDLPNLQQFLTHHARRWLALRHHPGR